MTGSHEVRGSIPLCSTTRQASVRMLVFYVINRGSEPERHIHQPSYLPPENYVLRLAIHKLMMVLGGGDMATKTATVMARVAPDVKSLAESIMEQLGIPASVVINSLYKQIIMTKSIPFSLSIPKEPLAIDEMDEQTFNAMMNRGYEQALNDETRPISEAFAEIKERL